MPDAVERGHKVRMVCKYNLEGETLYTLKWYRQELEFFRYTPKETPKIKFFRMKPYPELEIIVSFFFASYFLNWCQGPIDLIVSYYKVYAETESWPKTEKRKANNFWKPKAKSGTDLDK